MTKAKTKELTTTKTTGITTHTDTAWGTEGVDNADVLVSRIHLLQNSSKAVAAETANAGDIIDTVTSEVIVKKGETVEFIPISSFKTTVLMSADGTNQFVGSRDFKPEDRFSREPVEENGQTVKLFPMLNFYVMLKNDLSEATAMPKVISFKSTNYVVGKKLVTFFKTCQMRNVPPCSKSFLLGSEKHTNDKGTWYVNTLKEHETTTEENVGKLWEWYQVLKGDNVQVDSIEKEVDTTTDDIPF